MKGKGGLNEICIFLSAIWQIYSLRDLEHSQKLNTGVTSCIYFISGLTSKGILA